MTDYSQTGEQAAILSAVEGVETHRRFLDIGAWNAKDKSNTRALWELGWSGIFVEPSPGPLKGLVAEYGMSERAIVIGAAVATTPGLIELLVTDDAVTCIPGSVGAKVWQEIGGFYGKVHIPAVTLADLVNQFGGGFEMISIDTEGTSVNLFIEMLRIGVRPRCVVVEHDNRIVEIAGYAQANGYTQVLLNGNNVVYRWN